MRKHIIKPQNFPALLKEISDPPKELRAIGELPSDDSLFIGVVGSRRFTTYGKEVCNKIIRELKNPETEVVIVSGLAIGIDGIAHQAALNAGLRTIAIPGSGLDEKVLHPRSNIKLARKIVESGGCLLSELDWSEPAGTHTFPRRNRIIAGLCHGVVVIEAASKSGTLITAKLALDYDRDVFAAPGSIFSINSSGTNNLIKEGATPVTDGKDILKFYGISDGVGETSANLSFDFSPAEQKVLNALTELMEKDELLRKLKMPMTEASSLLMEMELKGVIKQSGGEVFLTANVNLT
ncbi:MAG: DNA-protecting protein DprA [Candidatus Terrybacteria bacterium CG10_big_fil_rev_8_21_14_0_10_41_10]|uniref:DNA-protecting protein DprA n=1 Tax=Candidatus Terrybacteria bacterium CG10_big_fil_rev_8_21_14_0_10_41_10 TaxID=1975026 RepID=A0A2M8LAM5_9BACT|nr:MAG: DNA-protecting protein DprA [Candidatus Terrybacteria bacterium CG10_big_fil_rev_8_21_14_0_10_41_10]